MKKIYKIVPSEEAPELYLDEKLVKHLDGQSIAERWPDEPFSGSVSSVGDWSQFYRVGAGAFALSEEAWTKCEDMYYTVTENYIELLSVVAGGLDLRIIYPLDFLPASKSEAEFCDLTYASSLFRVEGERPEDVFCLEGMTQGNEFMFYYQKFGFKGLSFDEVWRGK